MNKKNFQHILYGIFGVLVIVGFGSLAVYGFLKKNDSGNATEERVDVSVWGTLPEREIGLVGRLISGFAGKPYNQVVYTEKSPDSIRREYIESIALGRAPDILLADHLTLLDLKETIRVIPFSSFPLAEYRKTFIDASDIFITDEGFSAMPFLVDPMVLYYNENLKRQGNIQNLPTVWSDFVSGEYHSIVGRYSGTGKSVVPLGAYGNYGNAVDLFTVLALQERSLFELLRSSGQTDSESGGEGFAGRMTTLLEFYQKFADIRSPLYSWNITFENAQDMFVGGRLLLYPGYMSEYSFLRRANPNLVIRATPLPQRSAEGETVTISRIFGFGIPNSASSPSASLQVIFDLIGTLYESASSSPSDLYSLMPTTRGYYPDADIDLTELAFFNSVSFGKSVYLSEEERALLFEVLRSVIVGTESVENAAQTLSELFE